MTNTLSFFQKRDLGEVIGFTFKFIGKNFFHFFTTILITHLPFVALIYWFVNVLFTTNFLVNFFTVVMPNPVQLFTTIFILGFIALLAYAYSISIFLNYYLLSESNPEKKPSIIEVLQATFQNYYKVFVTYAVYGLLFLLLMILTTFLNFALVQLGGILYIIFNLFFYIFTIFIGNSFALIGAISIKEQEAGIAALRKSWNLVRGYWWQTFGIRVIVGVLAYLIFYVLMYILGLFFVGNSWDIFSTALRNTSANEQAMFLVLSFTILFFLFYLVFSMLLETAAFAQYGNLSEQKYGSTMLAEKATHLGKQQNESDEEEF
jgi:hypothetical protein